MNLRNQLIDFDTNQDGTVDNDDFKWGLKIFKLSLSSLEMDIIYQNYSKDGRVQIHAFLSHLSKPKDTIERFIQAAYERLSQKHQTVTLEKLCLEVQVNAFPSVLNGKISEEKAFKQYMEGWRIKDKT